MKVALDRQLVNLALLALASGAGALTACGKSIAQAGGEPSAGLNSTSWPRNNEVPLVCEKAHDDVLNSKFKEFTKSVVACLAESKDDSDMQENMLGLLRQAYVITEGNLPAELTLPRGLTQLRVRNQARGQSESSGENIYKIGIEYNLEQGHNISKMQLLQANGKKVLSLDDPLAKLDSELEEDGTTTFSIDRYFNETQPDGLYLLELSIDGGPLLSYPVPIADWTSQSVPQLVAPLSNERLTNSRPIFAWRNPEARTPGMLWARPYVAAFQAEAPNYEWQRVWEGKNLATNVQEVTVGDQTIGRGADALLPGHYVAWVSFSETRRFGPIRVARSSATKRKFSVTESN